MLTEDQLRHLSLPLEYQYQRMERKIIERICRRIKAVGKLSASDAHELGQLAYLGSDMRDIEREIAQTLRESQETARALLLDAAKADYEGAQDALDALGRPLGSIEQNAVMMGMIESIGDVTAGDFENFSRTTGFVGADGQFRPMAKAYRQAIDDAVMHVRSGVDSFDSAMRSTIKAMADNGLVHVDYASGYRRRLDSSVRNAFSGAQQRLSKAQARITGEQIGADGFEISWHAHPRPDHMDFAGKQFSKADFERVAAPLLDDYNCHHRAWPIILGISTPAYTQEELDQLNAQERVQRTFEGKTYKPYEATQRQRVIETAIRREKDRAVAFAASGDAEGEKVALAKAAALNQKYKQFSAAMKLDTDPSRITVAGYTRSQASRQGWIGRKNAAATLQMPAASSIIKADGERDMITGAAGAIPRSDKRRQDAHAERFYEEVRKRTGDVESIAQNSGFSVEDVQKIKQHVFFDTHSLGEAEPTRFDPDYDMAVSWQRLTDGNGIQEMDMVLLQHELMELNLMSKYGLSYREAHEATEKLYNYRKYIVELNRRAGL